MRCKNCGAEIKKEEAFCGSCGTKIDWGSFVFCPNCGEEITQGDAFCGNCGAKTGDVNSAGKEISKKKTEPPKKLSVNKPVVKDKADNKSGRDSTVSDKKLKTGSIIILAIIVLSLCAGGYFLLKGSNSDEGNSAQNEYYRQATELYSKWVEKWVESFMDGNTEISENETNQQQICSLLEKATNGGRKNSQMLCDYAEVLSAFEKATENRQKITELLKKAASKKNSRAEYSLSILLKDSSEGRNWFEKAKEHGNPFALHDYALELWKSGKKTESVEWFEKAAEAMQKYVLTTIEYDSKAVNGDIGMDYRILFAVEIGSIYEQGIYVGRDFNKAMNWYQKAGGGMTQSYGSILEDSMGRSPIEADNFITALKAKMNN